MEKSTSFPSTERSISSTKFEEKGLALFFEPEKKSLIVSEEGNFELIGWSCAVLIISGIYIVQVR